MSRIFISYRRADSAMAAGRLYDHLSSHFGESLLFMDIDTIEPGEDFVEVLENAVSSCEALIAVIGLDWLTVTDATGRRRLDNPHDFVRLEIATALERNIRVIPVLIDNAMMPNEEDLPEPLKRLTRRNALSVSNERFRYDVGKLIETLEKVLMSKSPTDKSVASDRISETASPSQSELPANQDAPMFDTSEISIFEVFGLPKPDDRHRYAEVKPNSSPNPSSQPISLEPSVSSPSSKPGLEPFALSEKIVPAREGSVQADFNYDNYVRAIWGPIGLTVIVWAIGGAIAFLVGALIAGYYPQAVLSVIPLGVAIGSLMGIFIRTLMATFGGIVAPLPVLSLSVGVVGLAVAGLIISVVMFANDPNNLRILIVAIPVLAIWGGGIMLWQYRRAQRAA